MKSPFILTAMAAIILSAVAFDSAGAIEVGVAPVYHIYAPDSLLDNGKGLVLSGSLNDFFAELSYEDTLLRFGGQECVDIELYGLNIGYKRLLPIKSFGNIEGFISLGYYYPDTQTRPAFHFDGAWYAFNILGPHGNDYHWDHYSYELHPDIGCTLGGRYLHPIGERLTIGGGLSYRWLSLKEEVYGWNGAYHPSDPHWEISPKRTMSGMRIEIVFRWEL